MENTLPDEVYGALKIPSWMHVTGSRGESAAHTRACTEKEVGVGGAPPQQCPLVAGISKVIG